MRAATSIVVGLRAAGHDVISVSESMQGAEDAQVIDFANSQRRLMLTEDKDFGQLVFSATRQNSGVVLIRYPACTRSGLTNTLGKFLTNHGATLYSCFVVLEPGRARISRLVA